jgi:hypothetical protein
LPFGELTGGSGSDAGGSCAIDASFPLSAVGDTQTQSLDFRDAARAPVFQFSGTVCPKAVDDSLPVPAVAYVAQNLTDASAVLSAWLVCDSHSAARLALYTGSVPPVTDSQIGQCATVVARGDNGYTSPNGDSNTSGYCPGLTKGNDGGLPLAPCETAVVYIQDYSRIAYPESGVPPPGLRVELQ